MALQKNLNKKTLWNPKTLRWAGCIAGTRRVQQLRHLACCYKYKGIKRSCSPHWLIHFKPCSSDFLSYKRSEHCSALHEWICTTGLLVCSLVIFYAYLSFLKIYANRLLLVAATSILEITFKDTSPCHWLALASLASIWLGTQIVGFTV